jgi:hypothetical protein
VRTAHAFAIDLPQRVRNAHPTNQSNTLNPASSVRRHVRLQDHLIRQTTAIALEGHSSERRLTDIAFKQHCRARRHGAQGLDQLLNIHHHAPHTTPQGKAI